MYILRWYIWPRKNNISTAGKKNKMKERKKKFKIDCMTMIGRTIQTKKWLFLIYGLLGSNLLANCLESNDSGNMICAYGKEVRVGLILDMESEEGKMYRSSMETAISDFYRLHVNYTTRLVLHAKDSGGEPIRALSAALDLCDNIKVEAIVGGQSRMEAKLFSELGGKARIPMLSLSDPFSSPTSNKHPFLVHISQHGTAQFKAIAATAEAFHWKNVILIHEDTDIGRDILYFIDSLGEKSILVKYRSAIAATSTDNELNDELHRVLTFKTSVIVVHISQQVLVSRLLLNAKKVGLMSKGFGWILTATTMNLFHSVDSSTIDSIQGVIGLKSYIPASTGLRNLTSRLRRKLYIENSNTEVIELAPPTIWAYDSIWALAMAAERTRSNDSVRSKRHNLNQISPSKDGSLFLKEIFQSRFWGFSGLIQFANGKLQYSEAFEIINFVGRGHRRVGLLPNLLKESEIERGRLILSQNDLEVILWPGGSTVIPEGRSLMRSIEKLRIVVPEIQGFKEMVQLNHDTKSNTTSASGYCVDVFNAAINRLPYQVDYEFLLFQKYKNGLRLSYNDLVMEVYLENYDAAVGDITIMSNRSQYVDFTVPFSDLGVAMLVRDESKRIWIFFEPFSLDLWITTTGFFITTGFIVWIIERPNNAEFQGSLSKQIGTMFWFAFSTLVFSHREKLLNNLSKFVVIVWVFVVLILTSNYTATLSSMMTVRDFRLSANHIGYQSGSLVAAGNVINNLNFKGMEPLESPEDFAEALSRGSKRGGVSAVLDEIPYIKIFLARYGTDRYSMVKTVSSTNGFGFAFRKGSPLVRDMSSAIMKLRESGELAIIEDRWFRSKSSLVSEDSSKIPNSLDLETFRGLFIITGSASGTALLLFLVFHLNQKWQIVNERRSEVFRELRTHWVAVYLFTKTHNRTKAEQTIRM